MCSILMCMIARNVRVDHALFVWGEAKENLKFKAKNHNRDHAVNACLPSITKIEQLANDGSLLEVFLEERLFIVVDFFLLQLP